MQHPALPASSFGQAGPSPAADARDKWVGFMLSLVVPGAGQLWAGSLWCLPLFALAGVASALPTLLDISSPLAARLLAIGPWLVMAMLSAEHAKRCLEPRRPFRMGSKVKSRVACNLPSGDRVSLRMELDVHRAPQQVWADVSDLPRFGCIDPFHSRITVLGPKLRPGVDLALEHRAFGVTLMRFGRLLIWREGCGYAFSDVSARGPRHGFPHVFFVTVQPANLGLANRTCIVIEVRGKWTARWVPGLVRRWWLRYVLAEHARLLRATL